MLGWRVAGSAFTAVCLLAGTGLVASTLALQERDEHRTYARPVNRIVVDLGEGRLSVRPGDAGVTVDRHLSWSWIRPSTTEQWDGQTLNIHAVCGSREPPSVAVNCRTDYALTVPPEAELDVRTRDGDIRVDGVHGHLQLASSSGGIAVTGTAGTVSARTGKGAVRLVFERPPVSAEAFSETGSVTMVVPRDGRYRIQATADFDRRISVAVVPDPDGPSLLSAGTGTGTIRIGHD
jgi:Putative adhesin